jgi:hypothetical protein
MFGVAFVLAVNSTFWWNVKVWWIAGEMFGVAKTRISLFGGMLKLGSL